MSNQRFILFVMTMMMMMMVSNIYAELARDDDDDKAFLNNLQQKNSEDEVVETFKRFLMRKKTTTPKPSSDAITGLILTSPRSRVLTNSTSSVFGDSFRRKSSSTSRYAELSSTSRYDRHGYPSGVTKDACGTPNPCKNGGTCRTLANGKYFCFCSSQYYGKTCEHEFEHTRVDSPGRSRKDHCSSSPCRNGAECVSLNTTYYCRCKRPYYGINCDKRL